MLETIFVPLVFVLSATSAFPQTPADSTAEASAQKQAPPPGPLLESAPAFSQWVITFSYPEDRQKSSNSAPLPAYASTRLRTITTTKTKNIVHEEFVDASGRKFDVWHVANKQYRKLFGSKVWLENSAGEVNNGSATDYMAFPPTGFRDLDWLSDQNYAGTVKYVGRDCLVFVMNAPPGLDLSSANTPPDKFESFGMIAFIDLGSRLPVEIQTNGVMRTYQFTDPPPDAVLKLPPDLSEQIKKGEEERARLNQRPPRPY